MSKKPHTVDVHVGARIREARLMRGLSQEALGNAIDPPVSFQQIQKYEKGANRVSSSRLWEIARALDVDIMYLFDGQAANGKANTTATDRAAFEPLYFSADEIELVRIYRGAGTLEVKAKMRDLLKAVAGHQPQSASDHKAGNTQRNSAGKQEFATYGAESDRQS